MGQETLARSDLNLARADNLRKVLVTGANGFIGSWIVRALVDRGQPARAFVRASADLRNLADVRERIEIVTGDLLDRDSLCRAMTGCRALIHAAGAVTTHPRDAKRAWDAHYTGALNTFAAARAASIERIVYTASIFTLGAGWKDQPADEEHWQAFTPRGWGYWDAKVAAQREAEKLVAAGLPLVFAYPTFCFGPGDIHLSSSGQLVDYLRGRLPGVTDAGINVIDVRDCALGHVLALECGRIGEKYLLAGKDIEFRELFARAGAIAGARRRIGVFPRRLMLPVGWLLEKVMRHPPLDYATAQIAQYFWYYRGDKTARELGLTTRRLEETLRDAIVWLRERRMI